MTRVCSETIQRIVTLVGHAFPVGQKVRFYPVADEPRHIEATVRSAPWALGHGAVVLKITGRTGCVDASHLERAD